MRTCHRLMLAVLLLANATVHAQDSPETLRDTPGNAQAAAALQAMQEQLQQRDVARAEAYAQQAVTLYQAEQGPDSLYVASALDALAAVRAMTGRDKDALPLLQRALAIREKKVGKEHPWVVTSLESLATATAKAGKPTEAVTLLERALAIQRKRAGPHDLALAPTMERLYLAQQAAGQTDQAARTRQAVLDLRAAAERDHPAAAAQAMFEQSQQLVMAQTFDDAAALAERARTVLARGGGDPLLEAKLFHVEGKAHRARGDSGKAAELIGRAVKGYGTLVGERDFRMLEVLRELADTADEAGQFDQALVLRRTVVEILAAQRAGTAETALAMAQLATTYRERGRPKDALPLLAGAREILERRGEDVLGQARLLNTEAETHRDLAEFDLAAPLYEAALQRLGTLGDDAASDRATVIMNRALSAKQQGRVVEAERGYREALAMKEAAEGADALETSYPLNNLGELLRDLARYDEARPLHERARAIRTQRVGNHVLTATSIQNLALLAWDQRRDDDASRLFEESVAMYQQVVPADHPLLANARRNWAAMLRAQGNALAAEDLLRAALAAEEKTLGPDHPVVAATLTQLGLYALERDDVDGAEKLLARAHNIRRMRLGEDHPDTATGVVNLAEVKRVRNDVAGAEALLARAQGAFAKAYGAEHPLVATCLNNRGSMLAEEGNSADAVKLLMEALRIRGKVLGPDHPMTTQTMRNLGHTLLQGKRVEDGVRMLADREDRRDRHLARSLEAGSQVEKLLASEELVEDQMALTSMHFAYAPRNERLAGVVLASLLRNKGRVLDSMTSAAGALRSRLDEGDRAVLDGLTLLRGRYAAAVVSGAGRAAIEELSGSIMLAERKLAERSAPFRAAHLPVTVAAVQAALPADAVLVEYTAYRRPDGRRWGEARYAAFILGPRGPVHSVDLGPADAVEAEITALRKATSAPAAAGVVPAAVTLRARLIGSVEKHLKGAALLLVSPSDRLHLVPWAALQDARGAFLVEKRGVVVLGSGRDVLRARQGAAVQGDAVVLADPDFGTRGARAASAQRGMRELSNVEFAPLPGTAQEAAAIAPLLGGVTPLTGARATEEALKQVKGPRILHVATHGFFLDDQAGGPADAAPTRGLKLKPGLAQVAPVEETHHDVLLDSGLALSGANLRSGSSDGVLSALEVSGLDLWGTQLVVLSACETGLGTVISGEGVLGLRRAMVMAGAQSQVMSLWNVDDEATRDLMIAFYRGLAAGKGRAEALRQAQLTLLRDPAHAHPYYWSAFTLGGDWRPMAR